MDYLYPSRRRDLHGHGELRADDDPDDVLGDAKPWLAEGMKPASRRSTAAD
jgi:hypothetical protein